MKYIIFYLSVCVIVLTTPLSGSAADEFVIITVEKGHSLFEICKEHLEYPLKWREIARINKVGDPFTIYPKDKIKIPVRLLKGIPTHGEITFIKGNVKVRLKKEKNWYTLHSDDIIKQGSKLKTGDESAVEITYEEGYSCYLGPNTEVEILTTRRKRDSHVIRDLFMSAGRAVVKVKRALKGKSHYKVKTRTAVIGVRGTEFRVSVDSKDSSRFEVLNGTTDVNAANKNVVVNQGEGTLVRKGKSPLNAVKLLPPPALPDLKPLYKNMPLQLNFGKIKGASSYRIILARDEELKDTVEDKVVYAGNILNILSIDDGTYYLQSRSIDSLGLEGIPSKSEIIKIRANPMPPFIATPADGAEYQKKSLEFRWLNVADAVSYHLQIAEDINFNSIVEEKGNIDNIKYKTKLFDFKTYYFRIRSIGDDDYKGTWSDIASFTVIPPQSSRKAETDEKTVKIRWKNLGAGIKYHFQMAKDKEFEEILIDKILEKPETVLQRPGKTGIFYTRVSSIDSNGNEGSFSQPQSFEISSFAEAVGAAIVIGLIVLLAM